MENCKCCGRTFNHHSFFYRPSVLSALEYACSLRCKNELVDAYTPSKSKKQKTDYIDVNEMTEEDEGGIIGNFIGNVFSFVFWVGVIVAILALGGA